MHDFQHICSKEEELLGAVLEGYFRSTLLNCFGEGVQNATPEADGRLYPSTRAHVLFAMVRDRGRRYWSVIAGNLMAVQSSGGRRTPACSQPTR